MPRAVPPPFSLSRAQLALELARPWLLFAAYAIASYHRLWALLPWLALDASWGDRQAVFGGRHLCDEL